MINISETHIFDIDGTIVPDVFNSDKFLGVEKIRKLMEKINLDKNFKKYYKKLQNNNKNIYFVTGRRKFEFKNQTMLHLQPLDIKNVDKNVIFFPDDMEITADNYNNFKIKAISNIVKKHTCNELHIYDDRTIYLDKLTNINLENELNIIFFHYINTLNIWKQKIKYI